MFGKNTAATAMTAEVLSPSPSGVSSVNGIAAKVLGETLLQFTAYLTLLRGSDEPEAVHQARVAWRRFKSDLRLFKPTVKTESMPSLTALQPLLQGLGMLRDLDVALTETLPQWRRTYVDGSPKTSAAQARRRRDWRQMSQALQRRTNEKRQSVRSELTRPAVVATLVALSEWVSDLPGALQQEASANVPLRRWVRHRLSRWHERFKAAIKTSRHKDSPERQHRARILAKRLRYGVEALGDWLPGRRKRRWRQQAADLQASVGAARDVLQAHALAASVAADANILAFWLRLADRPATQSS